MLSDRIIDHVPLNIDILFLNLSPPNIFPCSMKDLLQLLIMWKSHHLLKKNWKIEIRLELWMSKRKHLWKKVLGRLLRGKLRKKSVGCRWTYTVKHRLDLTVDRYKARRMGKGYTLTCEIDYKFMRIHLHQWQRWILFESYYLLLLNLERNRNNFMLKNVFCRGDLE